MTPARYGKARVPDALRFRFPSKWLAWVEIDGEVTSCGALSRCDADIWIDAEIARRRAGRAA